MRRLSQHLDAQVPSRSIDRRAIVATVDGVVGNTAVGFGLFN